MALPPHPKGAGIMNWTVRGTGAQAFTAATPADLLREMAEFVDEWTENDTSATRFVADVSMRFGGESATPWEGIVYTDNTEHLDLALARQAEGADSTDVGSFAFLGARDAGAELSYDEFEDAYEEAGTVIHIEALNVYLGEA